MVLTSHLGQTKITCKTDVFCWLRILDGFRTMNLAVLENLIRLKNIDATICL